MKTRTENVSERRTSGNNINVQATVSEHPRSASEAHRLIKECLLDEAEAMVAKYCTSGREKMAGILETARIMNLEEDEIEELKTRMDDPIYPVEPDEVDAGNKIWFDTEEDLNQAVGMWMYKGVAWSSKGSEDGSYFIEFPNKEILLKANEVIKRRWDLVDADQRTVGLIQFDNLKDYSKVLDFILKSNMMVSFGSTISDIGEDYDIEATGSSKKPVEATLSNHDGSFLAKNKKTQLDKDPDPISNPVDRIASVRKIWK